MLLPLPTWSLGHEIILISPRTVVDIPGISHSESLQNAPYQLLSNVEQTFSLLEFCVLVDLRIRQIIRPKMDGGVYRQRHEHSPYQHISCVWLHWECCVAWWHSQFLQQKLKDLAHVLMVRVFHVSQFWCWRNKSPCAIGVRMFSLITVRLELNLHSCFWNIRLLILKRIAPVSRMLFRLLFFHRYSPGWPEIPNVEKRFRHSSGRAPPSMVSLSPSESLHSKS